MNRDEALDLARIRRVVRDGTARAVRLEAGLSLHATGVICGCTGKAVALWESGARRPSGERGLAYARLIRDLAREVRVDLSGDES